MGPCHSGTPLLAIVGWWKYISARMQPMYWTSSDAATAHTDDDPLALVLASAIRLLDLYEENEGRLPKRNQFRPGWNLISAPPSWRARQPPPCRDA